MPGGGSLPAASTILSQHGKTGTSAEELAGSGVSTPTAVAMRGVLSWAGDEPHSFAVARPAVFSACARSGRE